MVYIDRSGQVLKKRPWDLNRVLKVLTALWFLVLHFFTTLIAAFRSENRVRSRSNGNRGSGSGGGGGSSDGSGGPRTNRNIGRITNSMDCNIPGGGCSGCGQ